jgi:hypothetical protein
MPVSWEGAIFLSDGETAVSPSGRAVTRPSADTHGLAVLLPPTLWSLLLEQSPRFGGGSHLARRKRGGGHS